MTVRIGTRILAAHLILAVQGFSATSPDPWEALRHVTWRTTYIILDVRGNCISGRIKSLTNESVTVKYFEWSHGLPQPRTITLERSDVLRISDGQKPIDVVYSGRSSWADVRALHAIHPGEAVLLITKDGTRHKGRFSEVPDSEVKLKQGAKTVQIAKSDVSQVYYIRGKPLTERALYSAQELAFFDPALWPYLLHVPPKVSVRVYDAAMPEDNGPCECKPTPASPP